MEESIISVKNISRQYGSFVAVDNLSFEVKKGEIFGLLGPNGAGKTTTIKMICGLLSPSSGEINIKYDRFNSSSQKLIGYCPQENIHWKKLNCFEQLHMLAGIYNLDPKTSRKRIDYLLESMFLHEKRNWLASKLSGGMQRRLNICLSLIHDPEIIIFDEPEAGLDPQSRAYIRDYIKNLSGKKTVVLTTHNMDEAERLAARTAIIDNGKLLIQGSNHELIKNTGIGEVLEIHLPGVEVIPHTLSEGLRQNQYSYEFINSFLIIKSDNISSSIEDIRLLLESKGITYRDMRIRQANLEDVFLKLTGRNLRV